MDSELWPECVLRDETLAVLGITDLDALLDRTPPLDHAAALARSGRVAGGTRSRGERAAQGGAPVQRRLRGCGDIPGPGRYMRVHSGRSSWAASGSASTM